MLPIIRKLNILTIAVIVAISAGLYIQFDYSRSVIQADAQIQVQLASNVVTSDIKAWLAENSQVVEDAADFVATGPWRDAEVLAYLKKLCQANPNFSSLYFGSANNTMINASGWEMPPGFDLRSRPWYRQAVQQGSLIYTSAFLNASKDDFIITMAKPVWGADQRLLGVIGGDVSLRTMIAMVREKKYGESGFSFLVDGNGAMVAYPDQHSGGEALPQLSGEYSAMIASAKELPAGVIPARFAEMEGYLAVQALPNTDWTLFSFIPMADFFQTREYLARAFVIVLSVALFVLFIFIYALVRYVFRPVVLLNMRIQQVDVELKKDYRIAETGLGEFSALARSMNTVLGKAQNYLEQLDENELELRRSEEKLRAGEARYRALVANSFEAIALIDMQTRELVEVNHRFVDMFGYELPQDSPLYVDEIVIDSPEAIKELYSRKLPQKRIWQPESRIMRRKNGTQLIVERAGSVIDFDKRQYFMATMRDMTEEKRRQARLWREIDLACRVQRELLPELTPSRGVEIRTLYYPSHFVSGDTFHLEWRNAGSLLRGFLVDVSGHGLAVAIQTTAVKVLLQESALVHLPLLGQVRWLNSRVTKYFENDSFAAIMAFELDLASKKLNYVSAGITCFFANGKKIDTPGMFIGVWEQPEFGSGELDISPGDSFYFLTDGFSDQVSQLAESGVALLGGDFARNTLALQKIGDEGGLRDDASGICLKLPD